MKTIEISGKQFELHEISHKFLEDYLDRVLSFVKKNHIESELHQDILQRLAEKLSNIETKHKTISEKDCIAIINQIGEPEDIFDIGEEHETINENKEEQHTGFTEELRKNGRERNPKDALFLGVSGVLARKIGVPTALIRGLFLILLPFYTISLWIYLALGFILPIKGEIYKNEEDGEFVASNIKYAKNNIRKGFRNIIIFAKECIKKILHIIILLFGSSFRLLGTIILIGIEIGLFMIAFGLLRMLGGLLVGVQFRNIDFTSIFPWYTSIACILALFTIVIVMIIIGQKLFKKQYLHQGIIISGGISALIATLGFISSGYHIFGEFSQEFTTKQNISFSSDKKTITLNLKFLDDEMLRINNDNQIEIKKSIDKNIYLDTEYTIWTKNENKADIIKANMTKQVAEINGNTITIRNEGNQTFSKMTPFSIISKKIIIYIPENIKIQLKARNYYNKEDCYGEYMWIDKYSQNVICENMENH